MTRQALLLVPLLLLGCDDHLFPSEAGSEEGYTEDYAGVELFFEDHCASCHPTVNPFDLTALESDVETGTGRYVIAGDAAHSQLWQRIAGVDGVSQMPPGGGLSEDQIGHVEAWINSGASLD